MALPESTGAEKSEKTTDKRKPLAPPDAPRDKRLPLAPPGLDEERLADISKKFGWDYTEKPPAPDLRGMGQERAVIPAAAPDLRGMGQERPLDLPKPAPEKGITSRDGIKLNGQYKAGEDSGSIKSELASMNGGNPLRSILELIQAGAYGYTGNQGKTALQSRLDKEAEAGQQAYVKALEEAKQRYQSTESELSRQHEGTLTANELAARERMLGKQLAAQQGAAAARPLSVEQYAAGVR